jgi:mRNA interferase RelE/StbE
MKWTVELSKLADSNLKSLDKPIRTQIRNFIRRLQETTNPRSFGKALVGEFKGLWRYRVGDYRLLCEIQDNQLVILVVEIEHRSKIYR